MKRTIRVEVEHREPGYMEAYIRQDGFVGVSGALRGGPEHDVLLRVLPDEQAVEPCHHGAAARGVEIDWEKVKADYRSSPTGITSATLHDRHFAEIERLVAANTKERK